MHLYAILHVSKMYGLQSEVQRSWVRTESASHFLKREGAGF